MDYELVVGLEVHVELATASKIFCGCSTAFGGAPNTQVCPVCLGLPGALPVLNQKVVELAVRTGLALGCHIAPVSWFDRKNYVYPDLPKAYQISQLYLPICRGGGLEIEVEGRKKTIRLHEIHMEEDAGKLLHDDRESCTLVDYNRSGVPLLEIVSEPDFRSSQEMTTYLEKLREILVYLGVSDCKMQEGSMRVDVNLSVRKAGEETLGTRTEMKNLSSLKAIRRAVEWEAQRQIQVLEQGGQILQETRRWDDSQGIGFAMRAKETALDYRYFPEPDLPAVVVTREQVDALAASQPELAEAKRTRYRQEYGLSRYDAVTLTASRETALLFEEVATLSGQPKETANLIAVELAHLRADSGISGEELNIDPAKLAALIGLMAEGKINRTVGKEVLEQIFLRDADPLDYVERNGLLMVSDMGLIAHTVREVLAANPKSVTDYRSGKEKAFGFLVGQTMKALRGRADPAAVHTALREALGGD